MKWKSIEELDKELDKMRWISVKERLPEEGKEVLTFKKNCTRNVYRVDHLVYMQNFKNRYRWVNRQPYEYNKITHWCEIPEMPITCKDCKNEKIACTC